MGEYTNTYDELLILTRRRQMIANAPPEPPPTTFYIQNGEVVQNYSRNKYRKNGEGNSGQLPVVTQNARYKGENCVSLSLDYQYNLGGTQSGLLSFNSPIRGFTKVFISYATSTLYGNVYFDVELLSSVGDNFISNELIHYQIERKNNITTVEYDISSFASIQSYLAIYVRSKYYDTPGVYITNMWLE